MFLTPPEATRTNEPFPYTTLFRPRPGHRTGADRHRVRLHRRGVVAHRDTAIRQSLRIRADADAVGRGNVLLGVGTAAHGVLTRPAAARSEEHTSELQSLMRISYAVFCLKKKNTHYR